MNWNKTFKLIEEAMGYELYPISKMVIMMDEDLIDPITYKKYKYDRQTGSTTAWIIRTLLNTDQQLILKSNTDINRSLYWVYFPCDDINESKYYYEKWFPSYVTEIYYKLNSVGLKTCLDDYFYKYTNEYERGYAD